VLKRVLVAASAVLVLGVAFGMGSLAYQRGSPAAVPTPSQSSALFVHPKPSGHGMRVQVPYLVGVPVERAIARLRRLGLNSRVWSGLVDSSFGSDILGQQPTAGTAVAPDTTIRLYIS
jgi:hypothetical protein